MKLIDTIRNIAFDIYPETIVVMKAAFRADTVSRDAIWNNHVPRNPEEVQQLADVETERFYRKSITAFLLKITFIGTPQKIKDTYRATFTHGLTYTMKIANQDHISKH